MTPQKVRVRAASQSIVRLDHEDDPSPPLRPEQVATALDDASVVLVADYGRGLTSSQVLRDDLTSVAARLPVVWDPHARSAEPVAGCRLVTPNRQEAARFAALAGCGDGADDDLATVIGWALALVDRWSAHDVAVTLGAAGALVVDRAGTPRIVPAPFVIGGDPCGAGDCFAGAAASALADGALPSEAVERAVAHAAAFVAVGGAASWSNTATSGGPPTTSGTRPGADRLSTSPARDGAAASADVRARGGTVVTTGGCFDLLHPGHVGLLEGARRLGDCLVVLINSDASVRRLKGPDRPLQSAADRAAVLRSLACVDEVVVFDEDTPEAALELLQPDLFVKGGDYTIADLPEASALARWGGRAVVLPYLPGRSTTRLVEEASRHADARRTRH